MRIIVDNLPADVTEDRLKSFFDQIGTVESVKIKTALLTRRPSGSGYVDMTLDVDAYRAINCLNNAPFKDRRISLTEAQPLFEQAKHFLKHTVHLDRMNFRLPGISSKQHDH
jgi:RNA recognition motif-containing protein